jgi:hypothetical protein
VAFKFVRLWLLSSCLLYVLTLPPYCLDFLRKLSKGPHLLIALCQRPFHTWHLFLGFLETLTTYLFSSVNCQQPRRVSTILGLVIFSWLSCCLTPISHSAHQDGRLKKQSIIDICRAQAFIPPFDSKVAKAFQEPLPPQHPGFPQDLSLSLLFVRRSVITRRERSRIYVLFYLGWFCMTVRYASWLGTAETHEFVCDCFSLSGGFFKRFYRPLDVSAHNWPQCLSGFQLTGFFWPSYASLVTPAEMHGCFQTALTE